MRVRHLVRQFVLVIFAAAVMASAAPVAAQGHPTGTPVEMVKTYESLAEAILAVKATEDRLVRSILSATYAHAQVELGRARATIQGHDAKGSQSALEALAADVGQIASEGDSAVGAVRKRLLEGGHHHHADGEAKGIYDEGYVVVTRVAKQAFLDSSRALGQMSQAPKADALEAEWKKVQTTWNGLMQPAR